MKSICTILALVSLHLAVNGQSIDTTLQFNEMTGERTIPVSVRSGTSKIAIQLEGHISSGSIEVELFDPEGNRQGGFQLNTSSNDIVVSKTKEKNGKGSSTRSVIKSSGSNTSVEVSTSVNKSDGKNKSKTKSSSTSTNVNKNSNSNSNDGEEQSTRTISVTSGSGENASISTSGINSQVKTTSYHGDDTEAKGVMMHTVKQPEAGTWRLVVTSEGANGELEVEIDNQ